MKESLLAKIERNTTEEIQVAIKEYKDNEYIDLRIYYTVDDGDTYKPTKKGVTIPFDRLDKLIKALNEAKEKICI